MAHSNGNPAELASQRALAAVFEALRQRQNFILEAGAGAGKTYSLVKALRHLLDDQGQGLLKRSQQIACITYTNIATEEIRSRTDGHPAILSCTVHSFCWSLISNFQSALRQHLPQIEGWPRRIEEAQGLGQRRIEYSLGYPRIAEGIAHLGHADVIKLTAMLMKSKKFRDVFAARYPIVLVDEYQDTSKAFAESLISHFVNEKKGPLIGFFGDHWQRIYGEGCGAITAEPLVRIGKGANFRSAPIIVDVLNRMRPELQQAVDDPSKPGSICVFHTNGWRGQRRTGSQWGGDLPGAEAHVCLTRVQQLLVADGWDFHAASTKILMLTHAVLAREQGYEGIVDALDHSDQFVRKEDPYIKFFADIVEPVCEAYRHRRFGEMFDLLGRRVAVKQHADKAAWSSHMDTLNALRESDTVGAVLDHLIVTAKFPIPDDVSRLEAKRQLSPEGLKERDQRRVARARKLRDVRYREMMALAKFISEATPFATKHGVKGAEFESVLVVVGRGWNNYDFGKMLEWAHSDVPDEKRTFFESNRNLFYVAISRPKTRLAVLFTQELSAGALGTLGSWFGPESLHSIMD